jgi:hypothetical protein
MNNEQRKMNVGKIEELTAFGGTKNLTQRTRSFSQRSQSFKADF